MKRLNKKIRIFSALFRNYFLTLNGYGYILNFLLNSWKYKRYNILTSVALSVRVKGKKYISLGKGVTVQRSGWLLAFKKDEVKPDLIIGDYTAIGDFSHITAMHKVIIEDHVLIANNVYISDNIHGYEDILVPVIEQEIKFKSDVLIGRGAWIGENVCIIGANVGRNSVIGANSVVTKDIPDFCVAAGSPAKVIKRFDLEEKKWKSINDSKPKI